MINAILKGMFSLVINFINILLTPINTIISNMLPGLNTILSYIGSFFSMVGQYFGWLTNALLIDSEVLSFLILYWTFKLTFPLAVSTIKLVVKWYNALKI